MSKKDNYIYPIKIPWQSNRVWKTYTFSHDRDKVMEIIDSWPKCKKEIFEDLNKGDDYGK